MVPLAVGTDGGGSIRIPSAFCGIYGHQADLRAGAEDARLPRLADALGRPARSPGRSRDLALALSVMAGPVPADPLTLPRRRRPTTVAAVRRPGLGRAAGRGVGGPRLRRRRPGRPGRVPRRRRAALRAAGAYGRRARPDATDATARCGTPSRCPRATPREGPLVRRIPTWSGPTPRRSRWPAGTSAPRVSGRARRAGRVHAQRGTSFFVGIRRAAHPEHAGDRVPRRAAGPGVHRRARGSAVLRRLVRAGPAGQPGRAARGPVCRSAPGATVCRSGCRSSAAGGLMPWCCGWPRSSGDPSHA